MTTPESRTEALREQLSRLYGLECVPAWGTPRNEERKTYGGKVAAFAKALGTPFMPWQRYVSDVALEVDPHTGLLAYRHVLLMVPRQSGKTTLQQAIMAWRACAWPRQGIVYTAQTRNLAREKWEEEHVEALRASPMIWKRVKRVVTANGREHIKFHNRSRWGISANTKKSGHGPTLDMAMIDEAFAQTDNRLEAAFSPAMITRLQPQLWIVSTAGDDDSEFLNLKRELAREIIESGQPAKMCAFDWTAEGLDRYDRTDRKVWRLVMPALGHTQTEDAVQAELESMAKDPAGFDRAYLNVTAREVAETDENVPSKEWPDLVDLGSRRGEHVALAVDITPDRRWACIAVYSVREDGLEHVEVVDHREGTNWLKDRLKQLRDRHDPIAIAIDSKGPGGALLLELEEDAKKLELAGKPGGLSRPEKPDEPKRGDLAVPTATEVAAACAAFTDACRPPKPEPVDELDQLASELVAKLMAPDDYEAPDVVDGELVEVLGDEPIEDEQLPVLGTIRHLDQLPLNLALANAVSRKLGDAYAWGRRASTGDISPLVAVTLARWAYRARLALVVKTYDPLNNIW